MAGLGLLDKVNFTWQDIAYLVNLTASDIVRMRGGDRVLRKRAQCVHAKLKLVQGSREPPTVWAPRR